MTQSEARQWLVDNAREVELAMRTPARCYERHGNVIQLPVRTDEMWGPDHFADWSHADLVWRIVFLQCVIKGMEQGEV